MTKLRIESGERKLGDSQPSLVTATTKTNQSNPAKCNAVSYRPHTTVVSLNTSDI